MMEHGAMVLTSRLMVVLLVIGIVPPSAGLTECIEQCVKTPAAAGHFQCCTNPVVSSFNKPSCATGCHMAEYSQTLEECNSWCEKASAEGQGCEFHIPGVSSKDGAVNMCGTCDCGLHDCPGHTPPEPEQCKDPANGGPDGGDCGWTNRCRGSLEGCKLGCKFNQADGRSGWGFILVLSLSAVGYVALGVGLRVKRNGAPVAIASHPHYPQWQDLRGLVADGVQMTRAKLTGKPLGAKGTGYTSIPDTNSSPKSSSKRKKLQLEDGNKKSKKGSRSSGKVEETASSSAIDDDGTGSSASVSRSSAAAGVTANQASKDTASAGGGRWVHVPS